MISQDTITKFADRYQTTELTIRREYLQHLFLSYFYKQGNTDNIYFKGGTALRFIYKSPRFSEDLDFSSSLSKYIRTR
ncbi:MAG: nucleotidyl transferase AbiEii/AbiGii toxin family protein [Candidatus Portnoybacteria bacterium]|nr:nucleotidyl transferase AbiEii/AbiGii toxin family protein [Candidatus Portnoybacteria bacterium]